MSRCTIVCQQCGKIFVGNPTTLYCEDCRNKKPVYGKREPKTSIAEVVAMTLQSGLSYGMQVAQLEGRI